MKSGNKKGFTLAEVLVTLAIVGVLASMTIPTLLQNLNDAQYKAAWKKAYADISQATARMVSDNGGSLSGVFTDENVMKNSYSTYLNVIKTCESSNATGNCMPSPRKKLDGTTDTDNQKAAVILNNGASLQFINTLADCSDAIGTSGYSSCGYIVVDVNGLKAPNIVGKDTFFTYITSNATKPAGIQNDWSHCNTTTHGWGYSAQYLYN